MPLSVGTRLGPNVIMSPLGAGGMGEVYKARDERLDRTVAIKVLPESAALDIKFRSRFEREGHREFADAPLHRNRRRSALHGERFGCQRAATDRGTELGVTAQIR